MPYLNSADKMATIFLQGNTMRVQCGGLAPREPPLDSTRGQITTFSVRSRARLLRKMNTLVFSDAVFSTYTYHTLVKDWEKTRAHWNRFLTNARRNGFNGLWVREIQKRGAYHYHVLFVDAVVEDVKVLDKYWLKVESPDDKAFKRYGIHHEQIESARRAVAYVAKYASKSQDSFRGRRWGVFGKPEFAVERVIRLTDEDANKVLELLEGKLTVYREGHAVRATHFMGNLGQRTPEVGDLSLVDYANILASMSLT